MKSVIFKFDKNMKQETSQEKTSYKLHKNIIIF